MHDLYVSKDPFGTGNVVSDVDASIKETTVSNVESSIKGSEQIGKSEVEKVIAETLASQNPKSIKTLDTSRSVGDNVVDVNVPPSVAVNVQMDVSEKISTGPIAESVKEKIITPDVA
ncbi:hypothetical protein A2U01_0055672 [Trifolium medium]|uniref:Uncharacterized protein n=1 Tax=Trifolium medium TaxID=97028 RepID=A0A392RE93_9FABA|nr:hypothetical protein [Trifolium medium]